MEKNCKYFENLIIKKVYNEISSDEENQLLIHFNQCDKCLNTYNDYLKITNLYTKKENKDIEIDFNKLLENTFQNTNSTKILFINSNWKTKSILSAAAAVIIIFFIFLFNFDHNSDIKQENLTNTIPMVKQSINKEAEYSTNKEYKTIKKQNTKSKDMHNKFWDDDIIDKKLNKINEKLLTFIEDINYDDEYENINQDLEIIDNQINY